MCDGRRKMIAGLRAVADFYESNPAAYYDGMTIFLNMIAAGRSFKGVLAATADSSGEWRECGDERYFAIARNFGEKLKLQIFAPRDPAGAPEARS